MLKVLLLSTPKIENSLNYFTPIALLPYSILYSNSSDGILPKSITKDKL